MTRTTLPPCRAPYPGGSRRVPVSIASPLTRPSPFPRRVGIRIFTFEACSGFTRVTARWIAQPPTAAFVMRLRPGRLPGQAARQLPDQSTTLWVEPSSTGDTRRRGALENPGYGAVILLVAQHYIWFSILPVGMVAFDEIHSNLLHPVDPINVALVHNWAEHLRGRRQRS